MLSIGLALRGYVIRATDGPIGKVADFLFDDKTWTVRWMVVDAGSWLTGRKVLIHPSAIGQADHALHELSVALTRAQIKGSPDIATDEPVSRQMQHSLYGYYGWDPLWGGGSYYTGGYIETLQADALKDAGDADLRSTVAVAGYHIQATDGPIGHLENFLLDDRSWSIRYLVIDTKNWWPGQHVLIAPHAVQAISWLDHSVQVDLSRDRIKGSPKMIAGDQDLDGYVERLHDYYNWPHVARHAVTTP